MASNSPANSTSSAAAPQQTAPGETISVNAPSSLTTCDTATIQFFYSGSSHSVGSLYIYQADNPFTNFPEAREHQKQLISDNVDLGPKRFVWEINAPAGNRYKYHMEIPGTNVTSKDSSGFSILPGDDTSCLRGSSLNAGDSPVAQIYTSETDAQMKQREIRTITPAVVVPVVVIGILVAGFFIWRRNRRRRRGGAVPASKHKHNKSQWTERFKGGLLRSPPKAGSNRVLGDNDDGAFGHSESYALNDKSGVSKRNKQAEPWTEFGGDDDRGSIDGIPSSPDGIHHRNVDSAASGRPKSFMASATSILRTSTYADDDPEADIESPISPTSPSMGSFGGRRSSDTSGFKSRRKAVPSLQRDSSANYSAAVEDPFDEASAALAAPSAAFVREGAANDPVMGKMQHKLAVDRAE